MTVYVSVNDVRSSIYVYAASGCHSYMCINVCICIVCSASRYVGAGVARRGDDMCIDEHRWCATRGTLNVPGAEPKLSGGISRPR